MFPLRLLCALLALSQLFVLHGIAQQYAFQEDSDNQGLNSLTINCLLQDRSGVVWACTENGLYQFDGSTYTRLGAEQGLLDSYILSIHQDAAGELWVWTSTGLYHGDGHHFSAIVVGLGGMPGSSGQQLTSTASGQVLAVSKRHLFQITRTNSGGTWSVSPFISPEMLSAHPELATIYSVYVRHDGSVLTGCGDAICQISGSNVRVFGPADGVVSDTWAWFLEDSAGRLWMRGYHHILQLGSHASTFMNQDIPSTPVTFSTPLVPIIEDTQRRILTRTDRGLAIWSQGRWQTLGAVNGLDVPGILSLMVDRDGTLWLGTYGKGVERWLGNGNWETWASGQGLEGNLVWSLVRDHKGTLWGASEHGIVKFDQAGNTFVPWNPNSDVPHGQVISVVEGADRNLWFSSSAGPLLRYSPDTGTSRNWNMRQGLRWIWRASSTNVWGMTNSGLYTFDQASNDIVKVHNPAVQDQAFYDVCEDAHHGLWFASNTGIIHLVDGQWSKIVVQGIVASDRFGNVACAADGSLWIGGASTGVEHLRVQGNIATAADPSPPPGFKSIEPMFLEHDRRGWLWIGSGSGVYVFNGNRWRHLTKNDGLVWNDCNEGSYLQDTDGSIWIGTSNGLSHLLHPEAIFDQKPLQVLITGASLGNTRISVDDAPSLPWTREPLRVHVVSSPLEDQPSTVYRYRLVGLEQDWNTTRDHDLSYSSLPDGAFRLEIYAEDTESDIRSPLTVVSFTMRPPWWKSLPFEIILGALLILMIHIILRHRERGLLESQAKLEALVRERTGQLEKEKEQLTEAREALRELASRDPMTGLLNRRAIYDVLTKEMARIRRDGSALTAVMVDLDHFKSVNDTYGHIVGDDVLREIAVRLTDSVRPYDSVSRYGGEEFLLVMPQMEVPDMRERLTAVHNAICLEPIQFASGQIKLTCSFGVCTLFGGQKLTVEQFLDRADRALYDAKHSGRNRIVYCTPVVVD
ncbi:MAG: diguanylate cyclase [Terracidiphilus sp.]|jgi:diguanylate cyclase (GGDEF)-like protein